MAAPPKASDDLRRLASSNRISKDDVSAAAIEKWFELGPDKVMLCRGVFEPTDKSYGEWWEFTSVDGQFKISQQLGWVHID